MPETQSQTSQTSGVTGIEEFLTNLASYSHYLTPLAGLLPLFGPALPVVKIVLVSTIADVLASPVEKTGRIAIKKLSKFKPIERCVKAIEKRLPDKLKNSLNEFREEFKKDPDKAIKELESFLKKLERCEELKREICKNLQASIKELLSGELGKERLLELFETYSEYVAYEYYAILLEMFTNERCLEILGRIGELEESAKESVEIARETRKMIESLEADLNRFRNDVESYFEGLKRELEELKLLSFGFVLLNLRDIVKEVPDRSKWIEGRLDLPEIYAGYDAPRDITPEVERAVEKEESVLILGKAGYGKTVLLNRIAVDLMCSGWAVVYSKDVLDIEKISTLNVLFEKLSILGEKVAIVIDNVHRKPEVLSIAYDGKLTYVFAAREEELLSDRGNITGYKSELEKDARRAYEKLNKFWLDRLSRGEVEAFVSKYRELFDGKVYSVDYYFKESKGEPLVLNLLLTKGKTPREYVGDIVVDVGRNEVAKHVALTTSLMHISGLAVDGAFVGSRSPAAFLRRVLEKAGVSGDINEIKDSVSDLRGRFIIELDVGLLSEEEAEKEAERIKETNLPVMFLVERQVLITRHELLAEMFLEISNKDKIFYDSDDNNIFKERVVSVLRAVFEIFGRNSDFTVQMLLNLSSLGMPELLVKILEEGIKWVDSKEKLGRIYLSYGDAFYECGADWWSKAEKCYLEAKRIYGELAEKNLSYLPDYVGTLNNLGNLYSRRGEFDKAEKCYSRALDTCKELKKKNNITYKVYYAMILNNLGILYKYKREFKKAEKYYLKALKIRKMLAEKSSIFLPDYAVTLDNLGILHKNQAEFNKAEEYYLKALEIRKKLAERNPAYLPDYAITLNNLGNLYSKRGKFDEAKKCYLKALEIRKKLAERNPAYKPDYAITLNNLGNLYFDVNFDKAEEFLKESLEIFRILKEKYVAYKYYYAGILNSLGVLYSRKREFKKAEKYYLEALEIRKKLAEKSSIFLPDYAKTLYNLGTLYSDKREFVIAKPFLTMALELSEKLELTELAMLIKMQLKLFDNYAGYK